MTDQSRVEAVADAVGNARNRQGNFAITCPGDALAIAQAAIDASDAWLKARGWKAVPQKPTEKMLVDGACCFPKTLSDPRALSVWEPGASVIRDDAIQQWEWMWNDAPEEPDK